MKFVILLLACLGTSLAAPKPYSLVDDIDDFLNLIDIDRLESVLEADLQNNGDLIEIVTFLQGDEFATIIQFIREHPGWQSLKEWLESKNIPVDDLVDAAHNYIQGLQVGEPSGDTDINDFVNDLDGIAQLDQIIALAVQKILLSADFRELIDQVKSENTHQLFDDVLQLDEVKEGLDRLAELGVDVRGVLEILYGALGWGQPPSAVKIGRRNLADELGKLIDILPVDDLTAILDDAIANDAAVDAVLVYLQSDRWNGLVDEVLNKPLAQDFIEYLKAGGIPVDEIIDAIREAINSAEPGVEPDTEGDLRPFLDEIEAAIPIADLAAFLLDELQNNEDVQDLYTTIASEDGKSLVDEVLQLEEAIYIQEQLTGMGVDVDGVLGAVYEFFGWGAPPARAKAAKIGRRNLADELGKLIDILPVDDLRAILDDAIANDAAVDAVLVYLQSDRWNGLVDEVLNKPLAQDFIEYLKAGGIPVDEIIDAIREAINSAEPGVEPDTEGDLRPFLDEIESAIPIADLAAFLLDELQNNEDVQDLYTTIASEDGKSLVDEVLQMEEAIYIQEQLTGMGVDVDGVLGAVYEFFGWGAPPARAKAAKIGRRNLADELGKLIDILPVDDLTAILDDAIANDAAVDAVLVYLQSDRWNGLVDEVLNKPLAQDFIEYLKAGGIPVDEIIDAIREAINSAEPGVEPDTEGDLRPFLDEIEAAIPIADLAAFLLDELQNNEDVQDLYTTIASEDGKSLVDEVLQMEEAIYIQEQLTGMGVDVDGVLGAVYEFFGWGAPPARAKAAKIGRRNLADELGKLIDILPVDDLTAILDDAIANDAAVDAVLVYLQSDRWNGLVDEVLNKPLAQDFIEYLKAGGIPVDEIIDAIREAINSAEPGVEPDTEGDLRPFLDEIEAAIPIADLAAFLLDELQNNEDVQDLYTTIASEDGKSLVDEVLQMEEAIYIQEQLTGMGVDVDGVLGAVYEFFGWGAPPARAKAAKIGRRNLADELGKLIDILPVDDLTAILDDAIANDAAVDAVLVYLQSDRWNGLVDEVLNKPLAQDFIEYLKAGGIPVDEIIDAIREAINSAEPGVEPDTEGDLRPFLDEIEAAIPIADLAAFLLDELQNNEDVQDLYTTIASEDGKSLVDEVLQMEEAIYIQEQLTGMGVDVDGVLGAVYEFFGWGAPPARAKAAKIGRRNLADELGKLIDILPVDDLRAILDDAIANDAAVDAVLVYLQSDRWNGLVDEVLNKPLAQDFIEYLKAGGIPVDEIIDAIREAINSAEPGVEPDTEGDLRPFLDEIEAAIPIADLAAFLLDELQNNEDVQDLYTTIASEDGKSLVDEVLQMEEAIYIQEQLTGMGVDVDGVLGAVYEFFGWGAPPARAKAAKIGRRNLADELGKLIDILPVDDLRAILDDAIANDAAVDAVLVYLQSDRWNGLVDEVLNKPLAQDFIEYLKAGGIPVDEIIDAIREAINSAEPGVEPDTEGDLRPFLDEIEAAIPIADLAAFLLDELQNNEDVQDLYTTIASEDGKSLVDEVLQMEEAIYIQEQLTGMGVDVDGVLGAVYEFFGWGAPPSA